MRQRKNKCISCGSDRVERYTATRKRWLPDILQIKYEYKVKMNKCDACGESFVAPNETGVDQKKNFKKAQGQAVKFVCDRLGTIGYTLGFVESALGLPGRTLSRWKSQGNSTAVFILMRMINKMPFLIDVANSNFSDATIREKTIEFVNTKYGQETRAESNGPSQIFDLPDLRNMEVPPAISAGFVTGRLFSGTAR